MLWRETKTDKALNICVYTKRLQTCGTLICDNPNLKVPYSTWERQHLAVGVVMWRAEFHTCVFLCTLSEIWGKQRRMNFPLVWWVHWQVVYNILWYVMVKSILHNIGPLRTAWKETISFSSSLPTCASQCPLNGWLTNRLKVCKAAKNKEALTSIHFYFQFKSTSTAHSSQFDHCKG